MYTEQSGFPLITASRTGTRITLTQKRFFTETNETTDTTRWIVPITVATNALEFDNTLSRLTYFAREQQSIEITIPVDAPFYVLNVRSYNFHRVNYDKENWLAIKEALNSVDYGGIHRSNRAQIIDDLFHLARAGYLSYDFILDILEDYIKTEIEYEPWYALLNGLNYLQIRIPDNDYRALFTRFMRNLLTPIYHIGAGINRVTHPSKLHWIRIYDWACKFGVEECIDFAMVEFNKLVTDLEINADLKQTTVCTGLRISQNNWKYFWNKYVSTNYATEQAVLLTALGCARHDADINVRS